MGAIVWLLGGGLVLFSLYLLLLIGIGCYVFSDSKKYGLNPLAWVLLAVCIPYFMGLVIYLFYRGNCRGQRCLGCGRSFSQSYLFCPFCGQSCQPQATPSSFSLIGRDRKLRLLLCGIAAFALLSILAVVAAMTLLLYNPELLHQLRMLENQIESQVDFFTFFQPLLVSLRSTQ